MAKDKPNQGLDVDVIKKGQGGVAFVLTGNVDKESITAEMLQEVSDFHRDPRTVKKNGEISSLSSSGNWGPALRNKPTLDSSLRAEISGTYEYRTPSYKVLEIEGIHQTSWLGVNPYYASTLSQTDTWSTSGKQITYTNGGGGVVGTGGQASWDSGQRTNGWSIYHDYTGSPTVFTAPLDGWITYFTCATSGTYVLNGTDYSVGTYIDPYYL